MVLCGNNIFFHGSFLSDQNSRGGVEYVRAPIIKKS
jgi:hypothetical protein